MTFSEQNVQRDIVGRFSEKLGSAAEASLAPTANRRWDTGEMRGERPVRPYLPLHPADDDEFFDAPRAMVLTVVDPKTVRYQKVDDENWFALDIRGEHTGDLVPAVRCGTTSTTATG